MENVGMESSTRFVLTGLLTQKDSDGLCHLGRGPKEPVEARGPGGQGTLPPARRRPTGSRSLQAVLGARSAPAAFAELGPPPRTVGLA